MAWRRSTHRDINGRDYCNGQFVPDPLSRAGIADLLRAAAAGMAVDGDHLTARILRKRARILEGRDGPGEPYRKHRRAGGQ